MGADVTCLLRQRMLTPPPFFLGGTIGRWAEAGWKVVVVRVTDDRWDSVGLDETTTIDRNQREFREATAALGVADVIDLGYQTDVLGDVSEVELREHMIRLVRTHRPYALVTFDPYAMYGEDNQDHAMVAAAVDEAQPEPWAIVGESLGHLPVHVEMAEDLSPDHKDQ